MAGEHEATQTQVRVDSYELQSIYEEAVTPLDDSELRNLATVEPVPPNGGYAWICTLSVFLINCHTWGINGSWAVIMADLSLNSNTIRGSPLEFALVGGLSISQALFVSPIVNSLVKRIGLQFTLLIGAVLTFVSLLTASFSTKIWHLFLSQGFCFGWGMGLLYVGATASLPSWFSTKRSFAVGVASSGAGFGGLIYSLVTNSTIQKFGVPWTYRILAFCSLGANLLAAALMRESGGRQHQATPGRFGFRVKDFGRIEVLLMIFWGVATEFGYIVLQYSIPSYAASIGLTPTQGSIANALLSLGLVLGRPVVGHVSDMLGRLNMALAMTLVCVVLCLGLWIPAQSFPPLVVFSLLVGAVCGTFWSTITPVLAEIVGLQRLTGTFAVICLALVPPTTLADAAAMQLVTTGAQGAISFLRAQIFVGCMFFVGALNLWLLRSWKVYHSDTDNHDREEGGGRSSRLRFSWLTPRHLFRIWYV